MRIGGMEIHPGEKKSGFLQVEGCGYQLPVIVIRGGDGETALVTAGIHCAFAFPILSRLLSVLYMSNTLGFIRCMLFCFAGFALLYVLVYGLTARVYYNIVSTRER